MATDKQPAIGLRPPPDLRDWLEHEAMANQRSLNGQVIWALQQYRKQQEATSAKTT